MTTRKVPVTIVTGFLGAGKTTLVRHVLENAEGRRLALIVNEFGDVGVDGDDPALLRHRELPGGEYRRAGQRLHLLHGGRRFRAGAGGAAGAHAARPSTSSSRRPAWRCRSRW